MKAIFANLFTEIASCRFCCIHFCHRFALSILSNLNSYSDKHGTMRVLIILHFFLLSFLANSQNPEWMTFNNANTSGGLPLDNLDCIAADCTNVVWIGTKGEGIVS